MFFGMYVIRRISTIKANSYSVLNLLKLKPINERVTVMGWVKFHRKQKENFLHVTDGSTIKMLQVVVPKSLLSNHLTYHTCVTIEGKIVESIGPKQDIELLANDIQIVSPGAPVEYPFTEKGKYLETDIRLLPHFRSRTKNFASLLRVRSKTKAAIRKYFEKENFINIDTPILTTNNCEGGSETFLVRGHGEINDHDTKTEIHESAFGRTVYLTVSGQLHLEAVVSGLSKVYNFNPAFRGETGSRFHLHEFWMVEMEEAFLEKREGFETLMDRLEKLVKFTIQDVMSNAADDVEFLWKFNKKEDILREMIPRILETPFVKLKYKEAIEILKEKMPSEFYKEDGLNKKSELFLTEYMGNVPVFITDWPMSMKPFYMYAQLEGDELIAYGMDLLMPHVGEVAGGSLREYRPRIIKKNLVDLPANHGLEWYFELRKFGSAPTGGFGLGLERFLQFFLGIENINDTIPFSRTKGRCIC